MRPWNFPERKNERRKAALARLNPERAGERDTLEGRITTSARDVRTKKHRASR